jgi:formate/nitrite transporter FocA (FNT family)
MDQPPPNSPDTSTQSETDHATAQELQAPGATVIHEALLLKGDEELERSSLALGWSGLAAGLSIGLSLAAEGALRQHLPDAPWRPLLTSLGYSVGFLVVIFGHQELYTENTVVALLPFLQRWQRHKLWNTMRVWVVVLAANLIGAFLFAAVAAWSPAFSPELRDTFREIGEEAIRHDPWTAFVKGIFGGWVIALMAWLLPAAETAKVWVIIILAYVLALSQFTHIIAGSVDVFYLVASGHTSFGAYVLHFGVPVWLGNTIGGVVLVAALNHTQVATS